MFAARARASLKPSLHGRNIFSLTQNRTIEAITKHSSQNRFINGERNVRTFHSSTPQCCNNSSKFDVGMKSPRVTLFSSLEDDFSELGCVKESGGNPDSVVKILTLMQDPSQKTSGKTKKKKKNHEQDSDSMAKLKLLTEKPELSWQRTNGKSKTEEARNVCDSTVLLSELSKSLCSAQDHISKAENIIPPSSEAKKEPSPSSVVVIRIGNLSSETTDSKVHSMCMTFGPLEGLARVNEDTVDVLFRAKNLNKADSILKRLKEATVDDSQWTAEIVPEGEEASSIDEMGERISSCFKDFDKQLLMRRVLVKDLEILLQSVMHLENHPMTREGTKALGCSQEA